MAQHQKKRKATGNGGGTGRPSPSLPSPTEVVVCIPTTGRAFDVDIGLLLSALYEHNFTGSGWKFDSEITNNVTYIEAARNVLVHRFKKRHPNADWLFFIDSDTIPHPDFMQLLLKLRPELHIVCGWYPVPCAAKGLPPITTSVYVEMPAKIEGGVPTWRPLRVDELLGATTEKGETPELLRVDGAATGCMLIHRKVLEDPRMLCGETDEQGIEAIFDWPRKDNGLGLRSDDLDFCMRAKKNGYNIYVDPAVRFGHKKLTNLADVFDWMVQAFEAGFKAAGGEESATADSIIVQS